MGNLKATRRRRTSMAPRTTRSGSGEGARGDIVHIKISRRSRSISRLCIRVVEGEFSIMRVLFAGLLLFLGVAISTAEQTASDDAGRVIALETAWNRAIEAKDAKAIEMILADSLAAVESDGSLSTKGEYLAG